MVNNNPPPPENCAIYEIMWIHDNKAHTHYVLGN